MRMPALAATCLLAICASVDRAVAPILAAQPPAASLRIVVIEGEDAVNVVQQKTAVAPVIEVRDRNNQPVAGAVVRFAIRNGRASFNGARALTVTTNAAGRAAAAGLTPTGSGALQISAAASFQGQSAAAVIAQTNVMTAAQAAAATGAGAGAGAGGGAAGGGTSVSATTLGVVGGAAAGGIVVARELTGEPAIVQREFTGRFSGAESLSFGGVFCRSESLTGTLRLNLTIEGEAVTGRANIDGGALTNLTFSSGCTAFAGRVEGLPLVEAPVSGTTTNIAFAKAETNVVPPNPLDPQGTINTHDYSFTGSLNNGTIAGTVTHRRVIGGVLAGTTSFQVTLQ